MVEWSAARAEAPRRGADEGARDEGLRVAYGVRHARSKGETRANGGRESATRAVVVASRHSRRFEDFNAVGAHQHIGHLQLLLLRGEVAPLDQNETRTERQQFGAEGDHVSSSGDLVNVNIAQRARFSEIGRDNGRTGKERFTIRADPSVAHQRMPARRDEYGIDH